MSAVREHPARQFQIEARQDAGEPQAGCLRSISAYTFPSKFTRAKATVLMRLVREKLHRRLDSSCSQLTGSGSKQEAS